MFANLKNKIREETGSDLSQLAPKLSGVQQRVAAGFRDFKNRGSASSLSALEEESVGSPEEGNEGMKLATAALKNKSNGDWKQLAEVLTCEKAVLEEEKSQLIRKNLEISNALKELEAYKKKAIQYQEDLDQLEGFQTQEMAKIKHLLLERDQQLTDRNATITKLQADVSRLRSCQEELSAIQDEFDSLRHSSEQQKQVLTLKVNEAESECKLLGEKLERAENLLAASGNNQKLQEAISEARDNTERRLEETRLELSDVKSKWCSQVLSLETQLGRLSKQAGEESAEKRRALDKIKELEQELADVIIDRDAARDQLKKSDNEKKEALNKIEEKNIEIENLEKTISDLKGENLELNNKCEKLNNISIERDSIAEKCVILENNQRDIEAENKLKNEINELRVFKDKFNSLETSHKSMENDIIYYKEQIESLTADRDSLLLRNASLSQQNELTSKGLQEQLDDITTHFNQHKKECSQKITELNNKLEAANKSTVIAELEEQLADKNKNIKLLQQRLNDVKKTLQKELKCATENINEPTVNSNNSSFDISLNDGNSPLKPAIDDVNLKYLKHVLFKFLTSREYEAKHLIRAISTLLQFTPEEEKLLRETMEWKMSWFGSKPKLGAGQHSKTIPPS